MLINMSDCLTFLSRPSQLVYPIQNDILQQLYFRYRKTALKRQHDTERKVFIHNGTEPIGSMGELLCSYSGTGSGVNMLVRKFNCVILLLSNSLVLHFTFELSVYKISTLLKSLLF